MIVQHPSAAPRGGRSPRARRGLSLIETQLAFVILGIGLAGLCPIVAMNYRQLANLEGNVHDPDDEHASSYLSPTQANGRRGRLQAFSYIYNSPGGNRTQVNPGQTHYIVPWSNPWARKLATRAQVVPGPSIPADPSVAPPPSPTVGLTRLERFSGEDGSPAGWRALVKLK